MNGIWMWMDRTNDYWIVQDVKMRLFLRDVLGTILSFSFLLPQSALGWLGMCKEGFLFLEKDIDWNRVGQVRTGQDRMRLLCLYCMYFVQFCDCYLSLLSS